MAYDFTVLNVHDANLADAGAISIRGFHID